jgi:endonuclease V-like protein UPF0215 family
MHQHLQTAITTTLISADGVHATTAIATILHTSSAFSEVQYILSGVSMQCAQ